MADDPISLEVTVKDKDLKCQTTIGAYQSTN